MSLFAIPSRARDCPSRGAGVAVTVGVMEGCGDSQPRLCIQVAGLLPSETVSGSRPVLPQKATATHLGGSSLVSSFESGQHQQNQLC